MKDPNVTFNEEGFHDPAGSTASSLVAGAVAHDPGAWERLVKLYGPMVYGWARRAGLKGEDASDVTQDVFRSVVTAIGGFRRTRSTDSFRGWLWTVTRNKVRDLWRKQSDRAVAAGGTDAHRRLLELPDEFKHSDAASQGSTPGLLARAVELVRSEFEVRTWQAFWRVAVDGQTPADAAAELGMTPNAVYVARSRILQRLRELLSERG